MRPSQDQEASAQDEDVDDDEEDDDEEYEDINETFKNLKWTRVISLLDYKDMATHVYMMADDIIYGK